MANNFSIDGRARKLVQQQWVKCGLVRRMNLAGVEYGIRKAQSIRFPLRSRRALRPRLFHHGFP
jgi:hypothetical protein